jgi:cell division protein FtsQ
MRMDGGERRMPRVARQPRNSVTDRPSKWRLVLRRQRWLRRPRAWIAFAVVLLVIVTAGSHLLRPARAMAALRERIDGAIASAGMRVSHVVIEGRSNAPEAAVLSALNIAKGEPILGIPLDETRTRVERLPWVEHATVERRLPGTIVLYIQERRPFAIWQRQGKFLLVDRSGEVVADQDVAQFRSLPLIVGSGAPAAAGPMLDALATRPALQSRVQAVVRIGDRRWNLQLASGTDVMLPEGHEAAALDRLAQLQQDHAVLDRPLSAIDMRLPDRLVLRPKADADVAVPPTVPSKKPS